MMKHKIKNMGGILLAGSLFLSAAVFPASAYGGIKVYPDAIEGIFPEGISISEPVVLGDIQLPDIEYGSLSWKDPSYVPEFGDHLVEVVMTPHQDIDLQDAGAWNEDTGELTFEVLIHVGAESEAETEAAYVSEEAAGQAASEPQTDGNAVPGTEQTAMVETEQAPITETEEAAAVQEQSDVSQVIDQAGAAEENHTADGIRVTGPDLPWNVKLIVGEADSASFTVSADADIFKAYDFTLWNLNTDSEYLIGEQSYVTFEIPVAPGYNYKVEHLKNDGTVETIIPAYRDGIIIFSTASLSSFGVAGSTPIIGEHVAEDIYSTVTPTSAASSENTGSSSENSSSGTGASETAAVVTPTAVPAEVQTTVPATSAEAVASAVVTTQPSASAAAAAQPSAAPVQSNRVRGVQTGDESDPAGYGVLLAFAGMGIGAMIFLKRKTNGKIF